MDAGKFGVRSCDASVSVPACTVAVGLSAVLGAFMAYLTGRMAGIVGDRYTSSTSHWLGRCGIRSSGFLLLLFSVRLFLTLPGRP